MHECCGKGGENVLHWMQSVSISTAVTAGKKSVHQFSFREFQFKLFELIRLLQRTNIIHIRWATIIHFHGAFTYCKNNKNVRQKEYFHFCLNAISVKRVP